MGRRPGRGEGSIRKRPAGLFEARFVGSDSKRHSLYATTRREAVDKLASAIRDLDLGACVDKPLSEPAAMRRGQD